MCLSVTIIPASGKLLFMLVVISEDPLYTQFPSLSFAPRVQLLNLIHFFINIHYNPKLETRIKCDASRSGHGAALEQLTVNGWKLISFASRFSNSNEERYSVNELELLGVVWSIEYLKNYLYGKEFSIITDHRALLSILKEHRSNKSYNSSLSRWVDRILPYQFKIEHLPGAKMGLVD